MLELLNTLASHPTECPTATVKLAVLTSGFRCDCLMHLFGAVLCPTCFYLHLSSKHFCLAVWPLCSTFNRNCSSAICSSNPRVVAAATVLVEKLASKGRAASELAAAAELKAAVAGADIQEQRAAAASPKEAGNSNAGKLRVWGPKEAQEAALRQERLADYHGSTIIKKRIGGLVMRDHMGELSYLIDEQGGFEQVWVGLL